VTGILRFVHQVQPLPGKPPREETHVRSPCDFTKGRAVTHIGKAPGSAKLHSFQHFREVPEDLGCKVRARHPPVRPFQPDRLCSISSIGIRPVPGPLVLLPDMDVRGRAIRPRSVDSRCRSRR
jgi:hypothetical protein